MKFTWFRKNSIVLLLAAIVGVLSVAPSLLAIHALGGDYKGLPFYYLDDEDIYTARMQEILDGHWLIGSPFFHEYKDSIPAMPPLGEYVYALPALVLRLPLAYVILASKFLFPASLFLLVYFLFKELCNEEGSEKPSARLAGIAAGLFVTLAYDFAGIVSAIRFEAGIHLSVWTRTVNPILGALAVFSFLIFFWRAIRDGKKTDIAAAGFILALSFTYFFSWGMILSVIFVFAAILAVSKHWKELKRVTYLTAVGIIFSLPFFALMAYSMGQGGPGSAGRNGMFFSRVPMLNKTLLAALAIFVVLSMYAFWAKKRKLTHEDWWILSAAILLGALWTFSQQLVTGRSVWPYHFVQYSKPLAAMVLVLTGFKLLYPRFPKSFNVLMVGVCLFSLANGVAMAASHRSKIEDFRNEQRLAPLFSWLVQNAPKDCVVLVDEKIERIARQVPAFTSCDVYLSSWMFSGVTAQRIQHNFFVSLELKGVTAENVGEYLRQNPEDVRMYFFEDWGQMFKRGSDPWVERKIGELVPQYQDFLKKDFASRLRELRIDFLVTEEQLSKEKMDWYGVQKDLGQFGSVYLYQ
ncbi:MAG: hypothetical protein WC551_04845 [Patescibacteria group bacterium]